MKTKAHVKRIRKEADRKLIQVKRSAKCSNCGSSRIKKGGLVGRSLVCGKCGHLIY